MFFRSLYIKGSLLSCLVYVISPVATGATSGAFSIDLGANSPIAINQVLTGTMDGSRSGAGSGDAPIWLGFSTNFRFDLPAGVKMSGIINGTVTSTNLEKNTTHTGNFKIDMGTLDRSWGIDSLLTWPEPIGMYESFRFTDRITLTGSINVTNANTTPAVVSRATFNFWGHRYIKWEVPIFGTVPAKSTCTISLSQPVISLGEIGFAHLSSAAPGSRLEGMSKTVSVSTECTRNESAKLRLKTTAPLTNDYCAKGDNFSMNFCAEVGSNKINVNGDAFNVPANNASAVNSTEVTFYATKGDKPAIGKSTAVMTIVASPE